MSQVSSRGYSALQIALHWAVAALVLFQIVFGESMEEFFDALEEGEAISPQDQFLGTAHYWTGLAILGLVAIRLMLRLSAGAPGAAADTNWSTKVAGVMHWLFYALLVAVPLSGLLAFYHWADLGDLHALAKPAFVVLVALHAMATLYHSTVLKDGTLRRMLVPAR